MANRRRRSRLDPRKLPAQSRSTATVDSVLEAAARILERHGFEGYTTNAIAERAGVSIGSFYQYFPNKDAVTVALIEQETAVLLADIATMPSAKGYEAELDHIIRSTVANQMRRPKLARLLDFEESRLPIRSRNGQLDDVLVMTLIRILSQPDAKIDGNVEIAAFDVLAIVKGMVDAAGEREETNALRLERRVRQAVFGYLGIR
jgi:AcrR family transcriptional regulator